MSFQTLVADRFFALYGHPQTDNPKLYFAEWKREFDGQDAEILAAAVNLVIRRHRYPTWPTIGDLSEAIEEVAQSILSARSFRATRALPPPVRREPTPEEKARVDAMFKELLQRINAKQLEVFAGSKLRRRASTLELGELNERGPKNATRSHEAGDRRA